MASSRGIGRLGATIVVVALLAAGCTDTPTDDAGRDRDIPAPGITAASLESFDACPELLSYLREEGAKRVGPYGLPGSSGYGIAAMDGTAAAESGGAPAAAPAQRSAEGTGGFSATNVQEEGVDEPDRIKTNGRYIFTTRSDENGRMRLVAVAIDDGRPKAGGSIQLPEGAGSELLLDGDRAVVIGGSPYIMPSVGGGAVADMAYPVQDDRTIVTVVDVSEPGEMQVTDVVRLEGSYASARMVGGIARLVLNTSTQERIDFEEPATPTQAAADAAVEKNKRIARTAPLDDWLPRFTVSDAEGEERSEGQLADCSSTYHPKTFSGFGTTTVVTLDPRDPDPRNSAAVVGGAGVIYASTDNLYVATQNWGDPRPLAEDRVTGAPDIAPIDPAKTSIHRFDIGDPAKAVYAASGSVRGTVLNQWSLSESEGHLRVATTEDAFSPQGASASESFVTVLDATEPKLDQVGVLAGLGVGERIYGVRFIGDIGYVVTFKQIDPLHVIDLSTPSKPRELGELKIPGYSAYLHPVGDGLLLGIGQDVDERTSQQLGTQVSLFDVSDPSKPTRVDQVRIDNASSPVESDHHAFTWWEPARLAVVPVSRYGGSVSPGTIIEPGPDGTTSSIEPERIDELHVAIGYRVDDGDIAEIGRADHARHAGDTGTGMIERSIVIGDELYTVSGAGIMSSDLGSFDERGWYAFES